MVDLAEVTCMLCGRTVAEAGSMLGDPVTGERLCSPCSMDWSPGLFVPTELAAAATATFVADPDDQTPPPPTLRHLTRVLPVHDVVNAGCHEVTLLSVCLYTDGFEVRALVRHPPGCTECERSMALDSQGLAPGLPDLAMTIADDVGHRYQVSPTEGGGTTSLDGAWAADHQVEGWPVVAAYARTLRIVVRFTDVADAHRTITFDVPLAARPGQVQPAQADRLARLAAAPRPTAPPDVDLSWTIWPDLEDLDRVVEIGQSAARVGVHLTGLCLDLYRDGFEIGLLITRAANHPESVAYREELAGLRPPAPWPTQLDTSLIQLLDDRGNRYPVCAPTLSGNPDRIRVTLRAGTALDPRAVGVRLHVSELVWWQEPPGMFGRAEPEPPTVDPGPFDFTFPLV